MTAPDRADAQDADAQAPARADEDGTPPPSSAERPDVLVLEDVCTRYPGAAADALNGVDLSVAQGEVVAVVGASGCGKTTLLRLVAGLEVPARGSIRIDGRTVAGDGAWIQPEERDVGMVFQDLALFPHLTVARNVEYGLHRLTRPARRERTRDLLRLVGLTDLADRHPHQLSGGQKQRVALARALAPNPRLLLLDEPFSNLDLPLKAGLQVELGRLLRTGRVPTLIVVHDVEDVVTLADRIVILREGCIVREGSVAGLCRNPGDPYVAGFFERLRSPTGNRFITALDEKGPEA